MDIFKKKSALPYIREHYNSRKQQRLTKSKFDEFFNPIISVKVKTLQKCLRNNIYFIFVFQLCDSAIAYRLLIFVSLIITLLILPPFSNLGEQRSVFLSILRVFGHF